jgi:hypothetical protein
MERHSIESHDKGGGARFDCCGADGNGAKEHGARQQAAFSVPDDREAPG